MRRLLVLALTAGLCAAPATGAFAQDIEDQPGLSPTPQTTTPAPSEEPEPEPEPEPAPEEPATEPDRAELPNTGSDARMLALAGLSLLLVGAGLRLRTIPEW